VYSFTMLAINAYADGHMRQFHKPMDDKWMVGIASHVVRLVASRNKLALAPI
jgi:hypothetical protein